MCLVVDVIHGWFINSGTEMLHRTFNRWVVRARLARSRRQVLQEAEDEFRLRTLEKFWETWRERRLKDSASLSI